MSVPPKTLKNKIMRITGNLPANPEQTRREVTTLASRAGMDIQAQQESLPVLEAFQEFLSHERQKTRKRIAALFMFFVIIIIAIIGAGTFAGWLFSKKIQTDMDSVQTSVSELNAGWVLHKKEIESSVTKAIAVTENIKSALGQEQGTLQSLQEDLNSQSRNTDDRIKKLANTLMALRKENSALAGELGAIQNQLSESKKTGNKRVIPTDDRNKRLKNRVLRVARSLQPEKIQFPVTSQGTGKKVNWRFPIQE